MAMEYELYPDGCRDLRAHVVVTSYEAPVDSHSRSFFRRIKWAGMIVDEGQRLKNDENLLYVALKAVKAPFQVLLTGTPLQNNKRELFNLLQFLDTSINAAEMDEKYAELTKENLPELHELIRPFFLRYANAQNLQFPSKRFTNLTIRRTKLQVLKFLPPMAQVILPVSMSVVQKKLYRSILAKNPELIKSILGQAKTVLRPAERGNLNNILMQLRKCLCHPFLYSSAIEEISKSDSEQDVQRKLVEASSKFQLLQIMLPKLKERGHRVLLFSQFLMQLDLIEDFLNGLDLPFQRLDGNVGSLEKQKRIDAFNAPNSNLFAFLLSTRAGGVGIKLQVLKFLPPMAQVILPVSMSVVQKKLYRSILAKNPELIKSILGQAKTVLRPAERGNLNNILMQLRKCLCHPFLYSSAIEEISKSDSEQDVQRKLVEASSKFQLLQIMLPKLKERGHRVLLFSQFLMQLDLIEDFLNGLDLPFQRLDGNVGSLEKQKRIDAFNAPNSNLFAFLLSTRAGGVGINLATADTVIIMDPDFNPHQDIQALSRAHRIGQKKKVLVFQLMTKDSAEEKIVQIGRKKMALDQALIESMGAEDDAGVDLESILRHGAQALFNDDDRNDIRYDSASVDKLLDRTQVENTSTDEDKTAESQFSFARVWANDKGTLTDNVEDDRADDTLSDPSVWDKILKQREADAAAEAARNMQTFGRGKRTRQVSSRSSAVTLVLSIY